MKEKGLLITFEGGEGAGKTTLIEKLYEDLKQRGCSVIKTREPGGTEIGKEVRNWLLHSRNVPLGKRTELLLFLADRAQHVDELILPALSQGAIVLCDRFNDSSVAYQGGARGIDLESVKELCAFACDRLVPDLTLYLDLDPEIGFARNQKSRQGKDRIESETLAFPSADP